MPSNAEIEQFICETIDSLRSLGRLADELQTIVSALRQCSALASAMDKHRLSNQGDPREQ